MRSDVEIEWFEEFETVVRDDLRFKARLRIGENAYTSLRAWRILRDVSDAATVAGGAAWIARSSMIASTFFAPKGIMAMLGVGVATTPPGWVLCASVVAGVGWYAAVRQIQGKMESRLIVVPEFINSPLDVLGGTLFELMAAVAMKLAFADGLISAAAQDRIESHFVQDWGLDREFVRHGLVFVEKNRLDAPLAVLARRMTDFLQCNSDCEDREIAREFLDFLREIVDLRGANDSHQEHRIEEVRRIFGDLTSTPIHRAGRALQGMICKRFRSDGQALSGVAD